MKKFSALFSGLILSIAFSASAFAQPGVATKTQPAAPTANSVVKPGEKVTGEMIESDVAEALSVIQENYVEGKKLNYNDLFKSSIESMLHTLDPHSNYYDAKEFEQFRTEQSSRYYGIGASIGDLRDENDKVIGTYIRATFENAPANRAGLRYGDKIVEVNGVSMLGKDYTEVRKNLLGPRGTPAKLVVERYETGKRETVDIIRDAVPQPSVQEAYMIRPGVGYIAMQGQFTQTIFAEFRGAMAKLKAQGMEYLILDLRNNGGGLVNQSYQIANTFLSEGQTVFTQKGRLNGTAETYQAENPNPDKTPIVMLVNRNTASASEILAGALQDHDRALIVGENTFGKGLVQNPFIVDYGSMLLLTIAKYETPSGRLIQRDYSNSTLYDYYTKGGSGNESANTAKPTGTESRTDSGRVVYGGGGINPDVFVESQTIKRDRAIQQAKLGNAIFAYSLNLATGKIPGFDAYRINAPIKFNYDLKTTDFPLTENLFQDYKKFAIEKYKISPALIDREREFVERSLRTELTTAAYGTTTSSQVFNLYDTQLARAIQELPKAKQLALEGAKANERRSSTVNK